MKRKILLSAFGGIALIGVVIMVIAFAMGGRPGTLYTSDGTLYYHTGQGQVQLGSTPGWYERRITSFTSMASSRAPLSKPASPTRPEKTGKQAHAATVTQYEGLGDATKLIQKIDIEIDAGYVEIIAGNEASITVEGPLAAQSSFDEANGKWTITAHHKNIMGNLDRFWWNDEDYTTTYTIVVPATFDKLDATINMGELDIYGLTLKEMDLTTDMGGIVANDINATTGEFKASMGSIEMYNFKGTHASLRAGMGSINFTGEASEGLDMNCDMGSITATVARPQQYSWDVEVGMGSVEIDDETVTKGLGGSAAGGSKDVKPFFEIECGMGSIELLFS